MELDRDMTVRASDGYVGTMRHLVVDPITLRSTHLVVVPHGDGGRAHLIPFGAIYPEATVGRSEIVLLWTRAEVGTAPRVEHEDFVAIDADDNRWCGTGPDVVVRAWPFVIGGGSIAAPR